MVKEVDVGNLKEQKNKILEQIKTIDKSISYSEFLKLKNEYAKIHNKIRYYTNEEFRKKSNNYSKEYINKRVINIA